MTTTAYQDNLERERAYRAECIAGGRECLTARDAARLFGVGENAIRVAKHDGRLRPVFVLAIRELPIFSLADLRAYFEGRAEPDVEQLAAMREHGPTCCVMNGDGFGGVGWILLTERPALRSWEEAAGAGPQKPARPAAPPDPDPAAVVETAKAAALAGLMAAES